MPNRFTVTTTDRNGYGQEQFQKDTTITACIQCPHCKIIPDFYPNNSTGISKYNVLCQISGMKIATREWFKVYAVVVPDNCPFLKKGYTN